VKLTTHFQTVNMCRASGHDAYAQGRFIMAGEFVIVRL